MNVVILDDVIYDVDEYVDSILSNSFFDFPDGDKVFKGIQERKKDRFSYLACVMYPDFEVAYNFVRKSPLGQEEPNYIHKDDMMGDITMVLYLTKNQNDEDGTTLYDKELKPALVVKAKYNRLVVFDSSIPHSRNIYENYGEGDDARLVQVIFMKRR